jgi:hypothetical protein
MSEKKFSKFVTELQFHQQQDASFRSLATHTGKTQLVLVNILQSGNSYWQNLCCLVIHTGKGSAICTFKTFAI